MPLLGKPWGSIWVDKGVSIQLVVIIKGKYRSMRNSQDCSLGFRRAATVATRIIPSK